ncbi:MAG: excinuclease ABC subunit UvrC [Armatimonadota bacterium]|nr:excinuclease ABC subunit UvrC [Armatimonadota bacterium]MDR7452089.1 excinuclease ABC subunit UvrC [Armatimonadota bacterium]MDR7466551.1 excinuclease ABC subunit UvrC [Armatimonadota bacterium]MDR7493273.1 excinuclease ABC subunit UvrC [Armatimonadota bacterium]MDR7499834.1 excinuclease ABC subunit UvrC [Armatimonadota bacterium]
MAVANLEDKLKLVPARPGVYLMKDGAGRVIYVGKAAVLRQRVRQYFQDSGHLESPRIRHLMSRIADFEVIACENEVEALILETNLIKRHRPLYNVRMADDKAFPYVKITNEAFPKILMTRRVLRDGARYFGPYPYHEPKLVRRTIRTIRKLFKLRSCDIDITRDLPRPCLDYYIGQCTAPCVAWGPGPEAYAEQVRQAALFLEGKASALLDELRQEMTRAAEAMAFERAAQLRDQIQAMEAVYERQRIATAGLEDRDVFALAQAGQLACVQAFFIRGGRLQGQEHFILEGAGGATTGEILSEFIKQYYQDAPSLPPEVVLQEAVEDAELIATWLGDRRGGRVQVVVPQRGDRRRLVEMAAENAALFLQHERARRTGLEGAAVKELQEVLGLETPPFRIEAYDISNFQSGESVGSMVVFEGGRPLKRDYRRFRMKWTEGPNDYAMLQEMLRRRFAAGREEQERLDRDEPVRVKWSVLPDLILIDGGRGQLNAAREVLFEYNHAIPAVALAKQEELVVTAAHPDPLQLPRDSHSLQLLQRLRDEAHRFANAYHRRLRERRVVFSVLDEIRGIGEKRKRDLIRRFGSVRAIRQATVEQIAEVVGAKTAQKVFDYLQAHPDVRYRDEAVQESR